MPIADALPPLFACHSRERDVDAFHPCRREAKRRGDYSRRVGWRYAARPMRICAYLFLLARWRQLRAAAVRPVGEERAYACSRGARDGARVRRAPLRRPRHEHMVERATMLSARWLYGI